MPYTIHQTDGTVLLTLPDSIIDTSSLPLALVGRGAVNYGTDFAQNFVHLLENFASIHAPVTPLAGTIWYDRGTDRMRYFNGALWEPITPDYTPNNVGNTLVMRDPTGSFAGNVITANKFVGPVDGKAADSTHADNADHATQADNATHAVQADNATHAGLADQATHATASDFATNAQFAASAQNADNAGHATNADHAGYADQAGLASQAFKLQYARTITLVGDVAGAAAFDGSGDIQINASVGGLGSLHDQIPTIVQNTLNIGRVPMNFVRVTNNIRSTIYTSSAGWITCMGPLQYSKLRSDTNLLILAEISSFNPTLGGAGAVAVRILDEQTGYADGKGLTSAFMTAAGAYNAGDTAVFTIIGGAAGLHNYYLQCARGDGVFFTTIFNPDNADFNGGAHTYTGSTSSFTFMEIIP
jgi:hypothetical protein